MADEKEEKPESSSGIDIAKLVAGGFAVISGAVTLVGGFTGTIPRILRNDDTYFQIALSLSLLAIGFALLGSVSVSRNNPPLPTPAKVGETEQQVNDRLENDRKAREAWETRVDAFYSPKKLVGMTSRSIYITAGFAAFVISAWVMISGMTRSLVEVDQPQISFSWKDIKEGTRPIAKVKVKVDGAQTEDTLVVTVHPGEKLDEASYEFDKGIVDNAIVYHANVGADLNGVAEMDFEVQVPENYGALQIVAGLNEIRDCNGELELTSDKEGAKPRVEESGQERNFSCVVVRAPIDGALPKPADPSISSLPTVTVTTTAPVPAATVVVTFAGNG